MGCTLLIPIYGMDLSCLLFNRSFILFKLVVCGKSLETLHYQCTYYSLLSSTLSMFASFSIKFSKKTTKTKCPTLLSINTLLMQAYSLKLFCSYQLSMHVYHLFLLILTLFLCKYHHQFMVRLLDCQYLHFSCSLSTQSIIIFF